MARMMTITIVMCVVDWCRCGWWRAGAISFQDFKDTVVQLISTEHFPERFTPWLFTKQVSLPLLRSSICRYHMQRFLHHRAIVESLLPPAIHCRGQPSLYCSEGCASRGGDVGEGGQRLINVLCAPDRRTQMDALRPWVRLAPARLCP